MFKLGKIEWICLILLLIGGINSGFIGIIGWDLIRGIFGHVLASLIYIVICLAAIYMIYAIWNWHKGKKEGGSE